MTKKLLTSLLTLALVIGFSANVEAQKSEKNEKKTRLKHLQNHQNPKKEPFNLITK